MAIEKHAASVADLDVLILVGAAHEEGKSTQLAHAVEEKVLRRGVKPTFYHIARYPVAACNNCGSCQATGECRIVNDPWGVLSRHMDSADVLFLVAPVFFAGPSGWLKAALDRCQMYWARKYVLHSKVPPMRPAHLLVVGDGGDPFGSQPLETICTSALNCANLRITPERTHRFIGAPIDTTRVPQIVERGFEDALEMRDEREREVG